MSARKTLFDKIWESHVVAENDDGTSLLYIDMHLTHEVTSWPGFESMRDNGRAVHGPDAVLAVPDHVIPTIGQGERFGNEQARVQFETLIQNCADFDVPLIPLLDERQGIVHIIGPEQGATQPGITLVCGDSHTATHGALGCLAFGIGSSEVEHVLSTQTLVQKRPKNMRVAVDGDLAPGVTAKDMILAIIGTIGTAGGTGHVIEYVGSAIRGLTMEGRMTVCNMTIEGGARAGLIAADETTFAYVKGRPMAPSEDQWEAALKYWRSLPSDAGAAYDKDISLDAETIAPHVTWGTSPEDVAPIDGRVPDPAAAAEEKQQDAIRQALEYMDLKANQPITDIKIDRAFIGSCTNGRIEDMCAAAAVAKGQKLAPGVSAMVVPGSGMVKAEAEAEGLDKIFMDAGFEWRQPGCSMCIAMNGDILQAGERCASTSNRNFKGRQGRGSRTHLVSPAMAAAAAIEGHFVDVRDLGKASR